MAFEPGGYADKLGNRYEGRWVVRQLLNLLGEQIRSVVVEPVGDDEPGVDVWIERLDGVREAQQCKAENGSKAEWKIADLKRERVLERARYQLCRDPGFLFVFVSSIPAGELSDLSRSARDSTGDPELFFQDQIERSSRKKRLAFRSYCRALEIDVDSSTGRALAFDLLRRTQVHQFADDHHAKGDLRALSSVLVCGEPDVVIATLADYAADHPRKTIIASDIIQHLAERNLQPQKVLADSRIAIRVEELRQEFIDSIEPNLAGGKLIPRPEHADLVSLIDSDPQPSTVILHGPAGFGKSGVLYHLTRELSDRQIPYVALRLDRKPPRGSPTEFGRQLGLRDSPASVLAAIAAGRRAVLILDQLDALRWTSSHAAEGLEVCKSLLAQVRALRLMGAQLTAILCCRTVDLEHDPHIRDWLRPSSTLRFEKLEVKRLPDDVVKRVVQDHDVPPEQILNRRLSLLSCVQNLAMWIEIVRSEDRSPDFDSATELMRRFWKNRRQKVEEAGIEATDRDSLLNRLMDFLETNGVQSAPLRLIEGPERLLTELSTLGILTVSGKTVGFGHQSYFDFLIAERAAADLCAGSGSVVGWLGDRDKQSLFRREQLRQLLFLIADDDSNELVATVHQILESPNVRFHMKQLTIESIGQITPAEPIVDLLCDLLQSERWHHHVIQHVVWNRPEYVAALASRGILGSWLTGTDEGRRNTALWLLRSICDRSGELVASVLSPMVEHASEWPQFIQNILFLSEIATEVDSLFDLRLKCTQLGAPPEHVIWKTLAPQSPRRAIEVLGAILSQYPERVHRDFSYNYPLTMTGSDDFRAVVRAARRRPRLTWNLLFPHLVRLCTRQHDAQSLPRASDRLRGRIEVPKILVGALCAAGKALARRSPEEWIEIATRRGTVRSSLVQRVLVNSLCGLPPECADFALSWLISDSRRLRCGSHRKQPRWIPASRLIERMSPHCSEGVYRSLEAFLMRYRDPEERRCASFWINSKRDGIYSDRFGGAQYHLLPALCERRRSPAVISLIGCLREKFDHAHPDMFRHSSARGGWVRSPLNRQRLEHMSDKAWLRLIHNEGIGNRGGPWKKSRHLPGAVVETSVESMSRDFGIAAMQNPERFGKLALRISPNAPSDYLAAVLEALAKTSPPSEVPEEQREDWMPAPSKVIEDALNNAHFSDDCHLAMQFCWVLIHREDICISDSIVRRLIAYAHHPDPSPDELHVNCDRIASQCEVHDLDANAINCVRGVTARAMASLLFRDRAMLSELESAIEVLLDDPSPVVRVAAVSNCLPVWNIDRGLAVQWLRLASRDDERIGACRDAQQLYNHAFPSFGGALEPLILRMAASHRDDVAGVGAGEITARWIFHDLFKGAVEECWGGSTAQRKAVAHVAAHLVCNAEYTHRCRDLLVRSFDDSEEDVRRQTSVMLQRGLLDLSEIDGFLERYVRSAAFHDDPSFFLHELEQYGGPLPPFSTVIFTLCEEFARGFADESQNPAQRAAYAGSKISPLLLRLYEQCNGDELSPSRQKCLDMWDLLMEHQVGDVWALTRQLDNQ